MKIFDKRPLSLILCIMLGSFVVFNTYDSVFLRSLLVFLCFSAFTLSFIPQLKDKINRAIIRTASVCAIISMALSFVYFDLWFNAYDRYDGEVTVEGRITDIDRTSYSTRIYLDANNVNETSFSNYSLIVYVDPDVHYGFSTGSEVRIKGVIEDFPGNLGFEAKEYYNTRGYSGIINEVSYFYMTSVGDFPVSYEINAFRESICRRIILNSDSDAGGLLSALLMGEKEFLPSGTQLDFSRIGISHILALSGMHFAILTLGLSKLLAYLRLGKKSATVITVIFTLLYMTVTGFSLSVCRAGIMLIIYSLLYLFARTSDRITALFISVAVIIAITPYAIGDLSLWLSAFATLGIIVMSEWQEKKKEHAFLRWIFTSFLSSFFAISATFAITVVKFDGTSIFAPISTFIFSFLIELFIFVGILLLLLGSILPIKYIFVPIGNLIILIAEYISGIDLTYVSTNYSLVIISSLVFTLLFFAFLVFEVKRKRTALISLAALLISIFAASSVLTYSDMFETELKYTPITNDNLLLMDEGCVSLVDVSDHASVEAYSIYNYFAFHNLVRLDNYVLTNYSEDLPEKLDRLSNLILIRTVHIPIPKSSTEDRILEQIYENAETNGIKINLYSTEEAIVCGEFTLFSLYSYEANHKEKNLFTVYYEDKLYTYVGIGMLQGDEKKMALEIIAQSDAVIFGRQESYCSEYEFKYRLENASKILFLSQKMRFDSDILDYYTQRGAEFSVKEVDLIR